MLPAAVSAMILNQRIFRSPLGTILKDGEDAAIRIDRCGEWLSIFLDDLARHVFSRGTNPVGLAIT